MTFINAPFEIILFINALALLVLAVALVVLAATTGAPWPMALVMPAWTGSPDHVAAATAAGSTPSACMP